MVETMSGFVIDKDVLEGCVLGKHNPDCNDNCRAGYSANVWADGTPIQAGPVVPFRLYDDDGELYYEGRYGDAEGDLDIQYDAVLNFGEWDAGCSTVKVKRGNKWVQEIG